MKAHVGEGGGGKGRAEPCSLKEKRLEDLAWLCFAGTVLGCAVGAAQEDLETKYGGQSTKPGTWDLGMWWETWKEAKWKSHVRKMMRNGWSGKWEAEL